VTGTGVGAGAIGSKAGGTDIGGDAGEDGAVEGENGEVGSSDMESSYS
jgi:hypothetical protein